MFSPVIFLIKKFWKEKFGDGQMVPPKIRQSYTVRRLRSDQNPLILDCIDAASLMLGAWNTQRGLRKMDDISASIEQQQQQHT